MLAPSLAFLFRVGDAPERRLMLTLRLRRTVTTNDRGTRATGRVAPCSAIRPGASAAEARDREEERTGNGRVKGFTKHCLQGENRTSLLKFNASAKAE